MPKQSLSITKNYAIRAQMQNDKQIMKKASSKYGTRTLLVVIARLRSKSACLKNWRKNKLAITCNAPTKQHIL